MNDYEQGKADGIAIENNRMRKQRDDLVRGNQNLETINRQLAKERDYYKELAALWDTACHDMKALFKGPDDPWAPPSYSRAVAYAHERIVAVVPALCEAKFYVGTKGRVEDELECNLPAGHEGEHKHYNSAEEINEHCRKGIDTIATALQRDDRSLRKIARDTANGTLEPRKDDVKVSLPLGKSITMPRKVFEHAVPIAGIIEANSVKTPEACPAWEDHVWMEEPSGYFKCTKCTFVKSLGEIQLMDSTRSNDRRVDAAMDRDNPGWRDRAAKAIADDVDRKIIEEMVEPLLEAHEQHVPDHFFKERPPGAVFGSDQYGCDICGVSREKHGVPPDTSPRCVRCGVSRQESRRFHGLRGIVCATSGCTYPREHVDLRGETEDDTPQLDPEQIEKVADAGAEYIKGRLKEPCEGFDKLAKGLGACENGFIGCIVKEPHEEWKCHRLGGKPDDLSMGCMVREPDCKLCDHAKEAPLVPPGDLIVKTTAKPPLNQVELTGVVTVDEPCEATYHAGADDAAPCALERGHKGSHSPGEPRQTTTTECLGCGMDIEVDGPPGDYFCGRCAGEKLRGH
jgi:hypothetical protein